MFTHCLATTSGMMALGGVKEQHWVTDPREVPSLVHHLQTLLTDPDGRC